MGEDLVPPPPPAAPEASAPTEIAPAGETPAAAAASAPVAPAEPLPVEETLALIKPDAYPKKEEIIVLIKENGFSIEKQEEIELSKDRAKMFYSEHAGKPFLEDLTAFMSSGKIVALVLKKEGAIAAWRSLMGPTDTEVAKKDAPNSMRAKFGTDKQKNACHGSDSPASATREIAFFFETDPVKAKQMLAAEKVREYLNSKVSPNLTMALTDMARNTPDDPIEYLVKHLRANNPGPDTPPLPKIVFVLGGPGAGKGTQCERIVKEFGWDHVSAGDLLRNEVNSKSPQGNMIGNMIKNGQIVPGHITVQLLQKAIKKSTAKGVLVDGFPRKIDQAGMFEKAIKPAEFILFFDCPEEVMEKRLLDRGRTSGRTDDNIESIKKRFHTFVEQSMPVVEYYEAKGMVRRLDATKSPDDVFRQVSVLFAPPPEPAAPAAPGAAPGAEPRAGSLKTTAATAEMGRGGSGKGSSGGDPGRAGSKKGGAAPVVTAA
eukprot:CAMPEP_0184693334 /NCGR_PEP_ID=MMETSP0313-20130426/1577_1 /TAXON_ID=2792 /ORGANISM="Porphyridium aerugineum, Strain SAG 1380-2" /LENGTH=486 /DNA_ID=CAMNT_0027151387 /DNA_START=121 /DNA_END=1581 /DNA_ORIENTATION=-